MLAVMNQLTDKPEWRRKVFDETIVKRWKNEIVNDHGPQFRREPLAGKPQGFTSEMFEFVCYSLPSWCVSHSLVHRRIARKGQDVRGNGHGHGSRR
jgi:hypothetical protein